MIAATKKKEMIISYQTKHSTVALSWLQEAVNLSNAGMYYQHKAKPDETELVSKIEAIALTSPYYGYMRITKQLQRDGETVNHKKVYRIMGDYYLLHFRKNPFKPKTTDSRHNYIVYTNEIKYLGKVIIPGTVWVSDITYVWYGKKWCYLALIMDQASRKIVGYSIGLSLHKELCIAALHMALDNNTAPLYHHSDRGSQYCSTEYIEILKQNNITISMADRGVSVDNPHAESLNRSIKCEAVYLNRYSTYPEARQSIQEYIEVYNTIRLHSSIGFVPPVEYEANYQKLLAVNS